MSSNVKIARKNINNLRYADDTTLIAESEEEPKNLFIKVKVESEKLAYWAEQALITWLSRHWSLGRAGTDLVVDRRWSGGWAGTYNETDQVPISRLISACQPRDQCMLSCMTSACSATWSAPVSSVISACSAAWSAPAQLRHQCLLRNVISAC